MLKAILFGTLLLGFVPLIQMLLISKARRKSLVRIIPMVLLMAFASFYETVFALYLNFDTYSWFHIYTLLEFYAICYFYHLALQRKYKVFLLLFSGVFLILWLITFLYYSRWSSFEGDSYVSFIESTFVYIISIVWFKEKFRNFNVKSLWQEPDFYFIGGFILYFSGTFFLFLFSEIMLQNENLVLNDFWMLNIFLSLILRLLIITGIWKSSQT